MALVARELLVDQSKLVVWFIFFVYFTITGGNLEALLKEINKIIITFTNFMTWNKNYAICIDQKILIIFGKWKAFFSPKKGKQEIKHAKNKQFFSSEYAQFSQNLLG